MFKNNRGITLIALVITIIVLLILAGVAIASLTGNDNIIKYATNATNAYSEDSTNTETSLQEAENILKVAGF